MQTKPAYSSSLVQVKANQTIPLTLLHKLVAENPSALGFCVRESGKLVVERFQKTDLADTLEERISNAKTIMENRKKFAAMFCFHSFPVEYDEDETQPWVPIRDSKGNALLAVGIEGDFPQHIDKGPDKYSEAFMVMHDWLGPKIEEYFKLCGNNPSKLFETLKGAQFVKDFANIIGHRGCISFMPSVGEPWTCEVNDQGVRSPEWGEASFAYGYTEAVQQAATPAQAEPAPVTRKVSRYASAGDAAPPTPAPAPQPATKPEPSPTAVPKPEPMIETTQKWKPNPNLHGKPLKAEYRKVAGFLPDNWAEHPEVEIKVKSAAPADPHTETAIAAAMKTAEMLKAKGETMPVINGDMQKSAIEMIKKHLGDGSAVIDDPVKAAEDESKLATFIQLMAASGVKSLDDLNKWRASFIFSFVKAHPETAALALIQYRAERRDLKQTIADGEKKLGELTGTKASTSTQEQAIVQPQPEPQRAVAGTRRPSRYAS